MVQSSEKFGPLEADEPGELAPGIGNLPLPLPRALCLLQLRCTGGAAGRITSASARVVERVCLAGECMSAMRAARVTERVCLAEDCMGVKMRWCEWVNASVF